LSDDAPARPRHGRLRAEVPFLLELLALTGLAVTQPVLDTLRTSPDQLIMEQASATAIALATLIIVFAPTLVLGGLELIVGLVSPRARSWLHLTLLGLLTAVIALQVVKRSTSLDSTPLVVGALAAGTIGAALSRLAVVRLWLRYLAAAPLAFAVIFLSTSPVRDLLVEHPEPSPDVAIARPVPIMMIMLDELPLVSLLDGQGHIDREVFPNFAALADGADWYRDSTTVASMTSVAVPAILTGRYPERFGEAPALANYPQNLFTLLGRTYDTHASEVGTALCPSRVCRETGGRGTGALGRILGDAVEVFDWRTSPHRSALGLQLGADRLSERDAPAKVRRFLDSLGRSERPRFDYVHFMLPHSAWRYLPSGQSYAAPNPPEGFDFFTWENDEVAAAARQRHLLQVAYTDAIIGQIVARMKALRTYDDTLLIVTADHGVAFSGRDVIRGVSNTNYEQIAWTPLFVKRPGQTRGETSDRQVRSIDVLPTIADVIGLELPWKVDGTSVFRTRAERDVIRVLGWSTWDRARPGPDGYMRFDARAGFLHVLGSAVPKGSGGPRLGLYQSGPLGGLVGRKIDQLPRGSPLRTTARLDEPDNWTDVDPRAAVLPAYVSGTIRTRRPLTVAVTVNGVVGGTSKTFTRADAADPLDRRFFTTIPPQLLRSGRNELRVFATRDGEPVVSVMLSPVPFAS
jgi:hypothetical protein